MSPFRNCVRSYSKKLIHSYPRSFDSLRLYPHLQDTGGFFVTVLEKALEEVKGDEKDQVVVPEPA